MAVLIGALTIGFILSLLSLGVYVSFRVFNYPDMTTDGSVTLGAAVAASLLINGVDPVTATLVAAGAGFLAGATTAILHTRFRINELLSGILVMTALYSVNLHIMGRSNVPLLSEKTIASYAENFGTRFFGESVDVAGWTVPGTDLAVVIFSFLIAVGVGMILFLFFRTNLGTAMRATGNNPQMIRALGVNTNLMIVCGLALANGIVALSGALLAQYQGFADVQMGLGMLVWGIASLIIGESLVGVKTVGLVITGTIMGSVLFRLLVAIALRWGMNPNDLKLITAAFVFAALILPGLLSRLRIKERKAAHA
ncbi:MAG: ABC transporter permease [Acidobacteria bacterium]|nr:MAG: ABC transporter permease [Acidobacteriota bacterium]